VASVDQPAANWIIQRGCGGYAEESDANHQIVLISGHSDTDLHIIIIFLLINHTVTIISASS